MTTIRGFASETRSATTRRRSRASGTTIASVVARPALAVVSAIVASPARPVTLGACPVPDACRLRSAWRDSFHRHPRGRRTPWVARPRYVWLRTANAPCLHIFFARCRPRAERQDHGRAEDQARREAVGHRQDQHRRLSTRGPDRRQAREEAPPPEPAPQAEGGEERARHGRPDRAAPPPGPPAGGGPPREPSGGAA